MTKFNNVIGLEVKRRLEDISDIKKESAEAVERSVEAKQNADEAKHRADITKKQLEEAIKQGDQVVEVQTLRVDPLTGEQYATAADRFEANQREFKLELAQKPYFFNTIEDMKSSKRLKPGDSVITLGYHEVNDGGGGRYHVVSDDSLIDDGGSVHDLQNGLKAKLIFSKNFINVKWFGAWGKYGRDDTQAIKTALSFLITSLEDARKQHSNGGTLYFPFGIYVISEQLLYTANIRLLGEYYQSWEWDMSYSKDISSVIMFANFANKNQAAIKVVGYQEDGSIPSDYRIATDDVYTAISSADNAQMEDISIVCKYGENIAVGINLVNGTNARFKRVSVRDFNYSIIANNSWGSSFENIFSYSRYGGVIFDSSNNGSTLKDTMITIIERNIPEEDAILPYLKTGDYAYKTVAIYGDRARVTLDNVVVEGGSVALRAYKSQINFKSLISERISECVIDLNETYLTLDMASYWNHTKINLFLNVINYSRVKLINVDTNDMATDIKGDYTCQITTTNCKTEFNANMPGILFNVDKEIKELTQSFHRRAVESEASINGLLKNGIYYIPSITVGGSTYSGTMFVMSRNDNFVTQIFQSFSGDMYYRSRINGQWEFWKYIMPAYKHYGTPEGNIEGQLGAFCYDSANGKVFIKVYNVGQKTGWREVAWKEP